MVGRFDVITPLQTMRLRQLVEATDVKLMNKAFGDYARAQFGRFAIPMIMDIAKQYPAKTTEHKRAWMAYNKIAFNGVPVKKYRYVPPKPKTKNGPAEALKLSGEEIDLSELTAGWSIWATPRN
jgi:hypothetical protein